MKEIKKGLRGSEEKMTYKELKKRERKALKNRKGMSPVISTVILVAVTITVAVAVSYWMSGISSQYTKFEKVEIQSGVCTVDAAGNWTVAIKLKNSGTATATLISIFINDIEVDTYDYNSSIAGKWTTDMTTTYSLTSGMSGIVKIYISSGKSTATLSSGTTVKIKLHSASGMDYIKLVELV